MAGLEGSNPGNRFDIECIDRPERPRIGISACLTGAEVRYDGGHKRSSFPHDAVASLFDFVPLCPETGIGLSTPRSTIRLIGREGAPRAMSADPNVGDVTTELQSFAGNRAAMIGELDGFVLMKNSPSCGLERVKRYPDEDAQPLRDGIGLFAASVVKQFPRLPLEESGRLFSLDWREAFVARVFAYAHWRVNEAAGWTASRLIAFHSRYKYLLMAHDQGRYRDAGRLLANLKTGVEARAADYILLLMDAMRKPISRGGHVNALAHLQGYLKRHIDGGARQEIAALIDDFRRGAVPLLAVVTLLRHHLGRVDEPYAKAQVYLNPHPAEAGLRRNL